MSEGVRWLMVPWLLLCWCCVGVVLVVVVRGRKLGGQLFVVVVFTLDCFKSERVCYIMIIIT